MELAILIVKFEQIIKIEWQAFREILKPLLSSFIHISIKLIKLKYSSVYAIYEEGFVLV